MCGGYFCVNMVPYSNYWMHVTGTNMEISPSGFISTKDKFYKYYRDIIGSLVSAVDITHKCFQTESNVCWEIFVRAR